jgi:hypothetical protein
MPDFDFDSERDQRWIDFYDGEALDLMQGWWGSSGDPLYAIHSSGGNYAWVFENAISNLDADLRRVKKLGRNKFQLGGGTFSGKEIDELHIIRDALADALAEAGRPERDPAPSEARRIREAPAGSECPPGSQAYMVGYIHKISPSPQDVWGPVCLNDNAFSDGKTLGAALRKAHVLIPGGQVRQFRVEGDTVIVFPSAPGTTYWHSIILTAGVQDGGLREAPTKRSRAGRIEDDTPILPYVVADSVIGEVESYTGDEIPDKRALADHLADRADEVYQSDERFRRQIRAKGNKGRDQLYVFMRHWLSSELKQHHPEIFRKLPQSFWNGEPLHGHARTDGELSEAPRTQWPDWMILESVEKGHGMSPQAKDRAFELIDLGHIDATGTWQLTAKGKRALIEQATRVDAREGHSVRDYLAIDSRDRPIAGPFKSYSDARQAAGTGGAVQFVPTGRSAPPRASEAGRGVRRPPRRRR